MRTTTTMVRAMPPLARLRWIKAQRAALDALEEEAVREAREAGRSWEELGRALGVAKQAAWVRFSKRGGVL